MGRPKVLLADDHKPMVRSLVRFLDEEVEIIAIVGDGQALVDSARQLQPDVIVADISMPVKNGWEAFNELRTNGCGVPFIFLTAKHDAELAEELIGAGAAGFVLKHAAGNELIAAIHEVVQGRVYVSGALEQPDMSRLRVDRTGSTSS